MSNELLLVIMMVITYGSILVFYYFFDTPGLYCYTVLATIAANIEVLILVNAFGMEMTLGNILFASTFVVTDILSEVSGKKEAQKAVYIGIASSIFFIVISQSWLLYTPNANDWAMPAMKEIFSNTPRMMIVGIAVYAIVQQFDVWAYHKWWAFTDKKFGNHHKYLWVRNNASTLLSQFLNTLLFTFGAFYGTYEWNTLWNVVFSTYVIYIVTSLCDTPIVYIARFMKEKKKIRQQ